MCLAVCVPAISQYLATRHTGSNTFSDTAIYAVYCTAGNDAAGVSAEAALAAPHAHGKTLPGTGHAQACGYCSLLADHPPLASLPMAAVSPFVWMARAGPVVAAPAPASRVTFSPPARGPPALA